MALAYHCKGAILRWIPSHAGKMVENEVLIFLFFPARKLYLYDKTRGFCDRKKNCFDFSYSSLLCYLV